MARKAKDKPVIADTAPTFDSNQRWSIDDVSALKGASNVATVIKGAHCAIVATINEYRYVFPSSYSGDVICLNEPGQTPEEVMPN